MHCNDVITGMMASQITSLTNVYSTVYSDADQRKHQNSASLAFVRGIHRGPVNSPHKWPVTQKMFPFNDVIMDKTPTKNKARTPNTVDKYWDILYTMRLAINSILFSQTACSHRIKWFSALMPLVRGIHQPPVYSPNTVTVIWSFDVSFHGSLNKLINKQLLYQWSEKPWRSCDVAVVGKQNEAIEKKNNVALRSTWEARAEGHGCTCVGLLHISMLLWSAILFGKFTYITLRKCSLSKNTIGSNACDPLRKNIGISGLLLWCDGMITPPHSSV